MLLSLGPCAWQLSETHVKRPMSPGRPTHRLQSGLKADQSSARAVLLT